MTVNQEPKPLTAKINSAKHLEIGGCDLVELAKKYGTPLYVIDKETLIQSCKDYKDAFSKYPKIKMMYASKALCTIATSKIIASEGFGFDTVSSGEFYTVYKAGVDMSTVLFNGNNKSEAELELALELNIGRISVDNFSELEMLNKICEKANKSANILLRITPAIECHTHEYIQTGHLDSKFGFDLTQVDEALQLVLNKYKSLKILGLHAHVGSQIFETKVFEDETEILIKELARIKSKFGIELDEINIGGGIGVKYTTNDCPPDIKQTAGLIINQLHKSCEKYNVNLPTVIIEPGRSIISASGVTLYTIGSSKQVPNGKKYIAVDGGMADNIRPAMYGAEYTVQLANKPLNELPLQKVTIAGRFCESGDILVKDAKLPNPEKGDILCVFNTGAYNYSMASNYNRVQKPAMVLVNNSQSDIIVNRETLEDLVKNDCDGLR